MHAKAPVSFLLTAVAGCVDALCYILLREVYTANMTGNLISVGMGSLQHDRFRVWRGGLAVAEFLFGAIVGRLALRTTERSGIASAASVTFAAEAMLLAAFAELADPRMHHGELSPAHWPAFLAIAALPAIAMGMQNVTLRRVGPLTFYTTHVTGTLTRFAESAIDALSWDRSARDRKEDLGKALFMAGLLATYLWGAVIGVWLDQRHGASGLWVPVLALAGVIALDQWRPLVEAGPRGPAREHEERAGMR